MCKKITQTAQLITILFQLRRHVAGAICDFSDQMAFIFNKSNSRSVTESNKLHVVDVRGPWFSN